MDLGGGLVSEGKNPLKELKGIQILRSFNLSLVRTNSAQRSSLLKSAIDTQGRSLFDYTQKEPVSRAEKEEQGAGPGLFPLYDKLTVFKMS